MEPLVGRVYVLSNRAMPGLVKIGFTMGTVESRAAELSSTGVPEPFEIEYQAECRDAQRVEQQVHQAFKAKRLSSGREFFYVTREEARLKIREFACVLDDEARFPVTSEQIESELQRIHVARDEARIKLLKSKEIEARNDERRVAQEAENRKVAEHELEASQCQCLPKYEFAFGVYARCLTIPMFGYHRYINPSLVRIDGDRLSWWEAETYASSGQVSGSPAGTRCVKTCTVVTRYLATGRFKEEQWARFYSDTAGTVFLSEKRGQGYYGDLQSYVENKSKYSPAFNQLIAPISQVKAFFMTSAI